MARPERLELPTLCFEGRCSIQLSYGRFSNSRRFRCIVTIYFAIFPASRGWPKPSLCPNGMAPIE